MSIPESWYISLLPLVGKKGVQSGLDSTRIGADKHIGTHGAGLRALGVVAKRDTWHTHHGSLLGDTTRIGDHSLGMLNHIVELEVTHWFYDMQIREESLELILVAPEIVENLSRAWMDWEDDRQAVYIGDDLLHECLEVLLLVHIGRTVHGHYHILLLLQSQRIVHSRFAEVLAISEQGINHHITYPPHQLWCLDSRILLLWQSSSTVADMVVL